MIGVVILQHRIDCESLGQKLPAGVPVRIAAGGIGRAVRSVAADRENRRPGQSSNAGGGGQGDFLIPAAEPVSGEFNNSFTAGDKGQGFAVRCMGLQNGGEEAAGLPGLTAELISQQNGLMAEIAAGFCRR